MKSKRGALHSLTLLASQVGQTPLFMASYKGWRPVVQFLVERGANLGSATKYALDLGHLPTVKLLVECGANVDAADKVASHQSASY